MLITLSSGIPLWPLLIALFFVFAGTAVLLCLQLTASLYQRRLRARAPEPCRSPQEPLWHTLSVEQALAQLDAACAAGLSQQEAARRIRNHGPNELTKARPRPIWHMFLVQFKSFLIIVLFAAAILAAAIGNLVDGAVILIVVLINAVLGFSQEFQA